MFELNLSKT